MTAKLRFSTFAAAVLLTAIAPAAEARSRAAPWPQAQSDIPADSDVRFGVLPNGMRYAIQRNATPKGQAALRLYIHAGSLMETDAEQGLAHFLEHMAFEGSKRVPNGEMIKILQRHGLAFGADTNAHTSWDETVYQLDLPANDEDTIDTGLMLFRESAGDLLISPDAINRERGVILSEERLRDTPGLRVFRQGIAFTLKDQLAARRLPIGKVAVIKGADHALLKGFYDKYYRPERATLVAVGDFDVAAMEAKIKTRFGSWAPRRAPGSEPKLGALLRRGPEAKLVIEPGAPLQIQLQWLNPADLNADRAARRRRQLIDQLGLAVFDRRLERLARSDQPPFIEAQASREDEFHSAQPTTLSLAARPEQWRAALAAADQEQRRLVQYGVRQDELDREITESRVQLQAALAAAPTRKTTRIADEIVDSFGDKSVYTSPATDLALFEAEVKGLTAAEVSQNLKQVFSGQGPLLFMASPGPIEGGEAALRHAYADSRATTVAPSVATAARTWPYSSFGAPGKVADNQTLADLGASLVRFENGVRLTVKPTKFRDNQVLVRVRIGHGLLDLPRDHLTPVWAARFGAFTEGGLKAISAEDMERILASNIFGADFATGEDAFVLQGSTRPQDLPVQLQVLAAYASDPGFRPEAFQRVRSYMATLHDQLAATPNGVMNRDLNRLLHVGDARFTFPSPADIASSTPAQFEAAVAGPLAAGQIEVLIVGDVTVDQAIERTAATFGSLPARPAAPAPDAASRAETLPAPAPMPVELSHKGRTDQAVAYAAWPTDDFFSSPQQARTIRVMAQIVENRLVEGLRETEGATYSPQASATASQVFAHYGYVSSAVEIPPAKISAFYDDLAKISADLKAQDVSADELQRAKKPLIEGLEKARQTNEYWLEQLSGAQDDPRKLDAVRTVQQSLEQVDAAAVRRAAQAYLQGDKLWRLVITPAASAPAKASAP